jgi:putative ATPase
MKHMPVKQSEHTQPLADRIRPDSLEEFIGQEHLVAPGKPLYRAIEGGKVHSLTFHAACSGG